MPLSKREPELQYTSIPSDDADTSHDASAGLMKSEGVFRLSAWKILPWALATLSGFLNILFMVVLYSTVAKPSPGTFETGFRTELVNCATASAFKHIEIVQIWFTGGLGYRGDGAILIADPDPIRYFGDPRKYPEIDENWQSLTGGRYFRVTADEAHEAFGETYQEYWNDEEGGTDMFHTLHCVNDLRKAFDPEFYPDDRTRSPETVELHRNHCLNQLRQYVMCHGDLTPVPTRYFEGVDRNYVVSDFPHTCRNFQKLQTWMLDRHHGPNTVHSIGWNGTNQGTVRHGGQV
ncbi:hypothetical protein BJ170DRAFT_592818 [Xylariales sp. AK1849]|nr:hypothetical protein BJ170DRAFT_592818 [Xylariales sp. AK1849]